MLYLSDIYMDHDLPSKSMAPSFFDMRRIYKADNVQDSSRELTGPSGTDVPFSNPLSSAHITNGRVVKTTHCSISEGPRREKLEALT